VKIAAIGLSLVLALGFAAPADAASIKLGAPGYGGTGCPGGTASVATSGSAITVKFSAYRVAAGGSTGKSFDRKACALSIPVMVPKGQAVAIVGVDFTGTSNLPSGTSATFKLEQFLVGGKGPVVEKTVSGPAKGKFTTSSAAALSWSACGASTVLRTNSSLIVKTSGGKAASASIRSQDVGTTIVYRLKYKSC
jgi:hypothetical protein